MPCTNPMLMDVVDATKFVIGDFKRYEKLGYRFSKDKTKGYHLVSKKSNNMPLEKIESWRSLDTIEIPCGKCISCQLDKAKDWAVRCTHEASLYPHNYFITLTYNDSHLPKNSINNNTLDPADMKQFLKSVRQKFKRVLNHQGIRFIGCGEYNSSGGRMLNPHYHIILFNCPIPDLTIDIPGENPGTLIHKKNSVGDYMMWSKFIADLWCDEDGNSKGYVTIDDANFNTESYVSRYILKKQGGENYDVYSKTFEVVNPFLRCSNRPGIGYAYFDKDLGRIVKDPSFIISRPVKGPFVTGLPRYYKKHLFELYPELRSQFELKSKEAAHSSQLVRKFNTTTANVQRIGKDEHFKILNSVNCRNFGD